MRTSIKPITKTDVTGAMAVIENNIKKLVKLFGDPDEAVSEEAGKALLRIGELAVEPLAGAILRPSSPVHRIRAIFAVKYIRSRNSLAAQLALAKVEKSEKDEQIAQLASTVLLELTLDEVENEIIENRRQRRNPEGQSHVLANERLTELRARE